MNRISLLYTLDGLLKNCRGCSQNGKGESPDIKCKGCSFYPQIRWIGNQLGRKKQMAVLTLEEYQDCKSQGMTDTQIAVKVNTSPSYLYQLKKKWQISPKQDDTDEIKQKECTCKGKENNAKYEQEISDLKVALDLAEHSKKIFKNDIEQKQTIIENQHKDIEESAKLCKELNSEVAKLGEEKNNLLCEYDKLKTKEYDMDYTIHNQKKRIEDLGRTLKLYETENKAMRELLRLWI